MGSTPACSTDRPCSPVTRTSRASDPPPAAGSSRAAPSSATSAAPAGASARTCTSKSASTTNPSTRSPTSPGQDEMPRSVIVLVLLLGVLGGCQDPYEQDRAHDRRSPARTKPPPPQTPHGDNVS